MIIKKSASTNNVASYCDNFQGKGTADEQGGVFALRHVKFPTGYHASIYPDDNQLDFIITFSEATVTGK